jgi:DNA-binding beta-propeller fold protein YncE
LLDDCIVSENINQTSLDRNPRSVLNSTYSTTAVNVWYLSFHGGTDHNSRNNIHVYSETGEELRKALNRNSLPDQVELRELRGFGFGPDHHLYVVNAYREASQILRFAGKANSEGQHDFLNIFVAHHHEKNPQLVHPFNFAFCTAGNLHVSNQDTNCVSRYHGPHAAHPGLPMPLPDAIREIDQVAPGVFVPSAKQWKDGLGVVRDVLIGPDANLYVADRETDMVTIYDSDTGQRTGIIQSEQLSKPIHLTLDPTNRFLLIGNSGNDSVARYEFATKTCSMLIPSGACNLDGPAGMAFGKDGAFYVASRLSKEVLRFRFARDQAIGRPFIRDLEDNPEFLLSVTD